MASQPLPRHGSRSKHTWSGSLIYVSETVAIVAGALTVYYFLFPPLEPPPICPEYRIRENQLVSSIARHGSELESLDSLSSDLRSEHEATEKVIQRFSDLRRWESVMTLAADLNSGLKGEYIKIQGAFGRMDPDYIHGPVSNDEDQAWQNILSSSGWPSGTEIRRKTKYWFQDSTGLEVSDEIFVGGPKSGAEVAELIDFLTKVELSSYSNYDRTLSDTLLLPDRIGPILKVELEAGLYDPAITSDVLTRLGEWRSLLEQRQYEASRDRFQVESELGSTQEELKSVHDLLAVAGCRVSI